MTPEQLCTSREMAEHHADFSRQNRHFRQALAPSQRPHCAFLHAKAVTPVTTRINIGQNQVSQPVTNPLRAVTNSSYDSVLLQTASSCARPNDMSRETLRNPVSAIPHKHVIAWVRAWCFVEASLITRSAATSFCAADAWLSRKTPGAAAGILCAKTGLTCA
jgi:hypothetical protein